MARRLSGTETVAIETAMHDANRMTYPGMQNATATGPDACGAFQAAAALERACLKLCEASEEFEAVLAALARDQDRADVQEAIGAIWETMQLISATHARVWGATAGNA